MWWLVFEQSLYGGVCDARVNRLARYLISVGVGPESLVALAMRRSVDLVVGMYAVAKAAGGGVCSGGSGSCRRSVMVIILEDCVTGVCVVHC